MSTIAVPPSFDPAPSVARTAAVEVTAAPTAPIAGVADVAKPGGWQPAGCSGFGARLLADFAVGFGA